MPHFPLISVVLPVHNGRRYVAEAIQSVLAQTLRDFELILIDDGSTDRTPRILRELAASDARVRVVRQHNAGIVAALNRGLAESRGELIARMDADDVALPQRFERQVAFLREHPECVAVGGRVLRIDPCGCPLDESVQQTTHERIDAALLRGRGGAIVHPTVMMRRSAVERIGGYRAEFQYIEDLDLYLRLAEVGRLANLDEIVLRYRQHVKSLSRTRWIEHVERTREAVRQAHARRGIPLPDGWSYEPSPYPQPREQLRSWGWRALRGGSVAAARRHALSLLRLAPASLDSWRLMYCALRGR